MKNKGRRGFGAITKLPSGRYQASYESPDGRRIPGPRTFVAKADAEGFLAQKRREIDSNSWSEDTKDLKVGITFSELAERHIALQNTRSGQPLKASTQEHYRKLLRGPLKPFTHRRVVSISKSDVDDWWILVTKNGKRTTASRAYKLLAAVMKRALEDRLITVNPCSIRGAQSAHSGKEIACPSPAEVAKIVKLIDGQSLSLMVLLMAYAGLRFGEVTELRRKDLCLVEADGLTYYEIHVSRAVVYLEKEFLVGTPKSKASKRVVAVTSGLNGPISQFLETFDKSGKKSFLFFPSPSDAKDHMRNDWFAKKLRKAKKLAGLENSGITPHSFQHFAGTYFASSGANLAEVKEWLGDSSTEAVQRYLHPVGRNSQIVQKMPLDRTLLD
jgi:integrase